MNPDLNVDELKQQAGEIIEALSRGMSGLSEERRQILSEVFFRTLVRILIKPPKIDDLIPMLSQGLGEITAGFEPQLADQSKINNGTN